MRVLIADEVIIAGGVETIRRRLLPELAKLVDAMVWVLPAYVASNFADVRKACGNMEIETFNSPGGLARVKEGIARRMPGGLPRSLVDERLQRLAREHRCDVCMTTCTFSQPMPAIDLPVAGFISDVNPALPQSILDNMGDWVERVAATFAISDFTCGELKRMKPDCTAKIYSIPLAWPTEAKASGEFRRGSFYYPAAPNKHKGHLNLLEAARRVAARGLDFRLTLTGAGLDDDGNEVVRAMRVLLEQNRDLLNGRVAMAGDAPRAEVDRLFAEASCVVLPSSYEGFGLPLAEALGYGKRVICSDIPPLREQIERYGCQDMATFVPPGDAGALEEAMARHLNWNGAGLAAEELARRLNRWTWADAAQRCRALLEGVAGHG